MKKLLALVLALAMMFALAVPAFAASITTIDIAGSSKDVSSVYNLELTDSERVATNGEIALNLSEKVTAPSLTDIKIYGENNKGELKKEVTDGISTKINTQGKKITITLNNLSADTKYKIEIPAAVIDSSLVGYSIVFKTEASGTTTTTKASSKTIAVTPSADAITDKVDSAQPFTFNVKFAGSGSMKWFKAIQDVFTKSAFELYKDDVKVEKLSIFWEDEGEDSSTESTIAFTLKNLEPGADYKFVILKGEYTVQNKNSEDRIFTLANNFEVKFSTAAAAPTIIEGANQKVEAGKAAAFRSDADFADFQKVLVDDKEVAKENYTVVSGSTVVTLNADYVSTLSAGKHTISIVSTTGTATTNFEVNESVAATADNSSAASLVVMLSASAFALGAISVARKKED